MSGLRGAARAGRVPGSRRDLPDVSRPGLRDGRHQHRQPREEGERAAFLEKNQASYANYHYSGKDAYALIDVVDPKWEGPIPYTLIVKPGGEVLYRHLGTIEPLEVKKAIVEYLGRTYK